MTRQSRAPARILLEDMIEHAKQALAALGAHEADELAADPHLASTVLWPLTVVGEAASQLPRDFAAQNPEIAFKAAALNRNRIVHGYRTIKFDVLQRTVLEDLPLIADLERLLQEEPPLS